MADNNAHLARGMACSVCGRRAVACFAGTHNGSPVVDRYYCQADRLQMIVLTDDVVVELADGDSPEGAVRQRPTSRICRRLNRLRARPGRLTPPDLQGG